MQNNEREGRAEDFSELLAIVQRMEELGNADDISLEEFARESKVLIKEFLAHLDADLHLELSANVSGAYEEMSRENLLARVESVVDIMKCVISDQHISVGSKDRHYANSVLANIEGLRIAMAEADALGPIRLLVGLDLKALVGFKNDHVEVTEIEKDEFDVRDSALRKSMCRHVVGEIHRNDIRYIVMRIPRKLFPEEILMGDEVDGKSQFIFRVARVPGKILINDESLPDAA